MKNISVKIPFTKGRLIWAPQDGNGSARIFAGQEFMTHLSADHFRKGKLYDKFDLGSGLVTNVGVAAMANDPFWASPSAASCATLALANYHASGTGATTAAATDIALQTSAGPAPAAGAQTNVSAANSAQYKTVATLAYTTGLAITEWGLHSAAVLSVATGSPFTTTSVTGGAVTSTPLTASSTSVRGQQQYIVVSGTVWGLITSNTTGALVIPAWYKTADGTLGSTPSGTATYTLQPVMWDHKVFSAINVVNGDSIQFTYTLTINSGG